ncbi:DUF192 domain-containing protein [uncultured Eudoraea sp.]|uniref:DUF192 domain-containing protein n=1 Tax=uncultured Eudoraea sp. TaxID=1035614 RepID=UPI002603738B|nr:DUF192 domain-containing protein [uncultured Eudoraea sp.]
MKKLKFYGFILITTAFLLGGCKETPKSAVKTEPITFTKEGELSIYKAQSDSLIVSYSIEIAETDYETQTGLMYRESMETDQGMFFIFPDVLYHSFYMKNTKIPLDLIFIDQELKIASYKENAQPMDETGLSSEVPVQYVLELNAGQREKYSLEIGDRIEFIRMK